MALPIWPQLMGMESLKSAFPNTPNLSYLTMLKSLARLDDLDGMKKCFEKWELGCPANDIRIASVLINYYLRWGMTKKLKHFFRTQ